MLDLTKTSLTETIGKALEWLRPRSEPDYDLLPSEQQIGFYALRGYRGPDVLVAARPFRGAAKLETFLEHHATTLRDTKYRTVSKEFAERDVRALSDLAERADAVRVVPAY